MHSFRKRQNVKNNAPAQWPVRGAALVMFAAGLALGYLWLHDRCERTAMRLKDIERAHADLRIRLQHEESKWSSCRTLDSVRKQLRTFGVEMDFPSLHRVIYLDTSKGFRREAPPRVAQAETPRTPSRL